MALLVTLLIEKGESPPLDNRATQPKYAKVAHDSARQELKKETKQLKERRIYFVARTAATTTGSSVCRRIGAVSGQMSLLVTLQAKVNVNNKQAKATTSQDKTKIRYNTETKKKK